VSTGLVPSRGLLSAGADWREPGVDRPAWATDDVDLDRPSIARVYDYFLGGSHHNPIADFPVQASSSLALLFATGPVTLSSVSRKVVFGRLEQQSLQLVNRPAPFRIFNHYFNLVQAIQVRL
jgi:hypothetical protein